MEFYKINPQYKDRLMLVEDNGSRVTYGDFEAFYERIERQLTGGRLMFLFCENTIGSVFFYLACLNRRIVPLLLDKNTDRALLTGLIETYQPEYLAMPQTLAGDILENGGAGDGRPERSGSVGNGCPEKSEGAGNGCPERCEGEGDGYPEGRDTESGERHGDGNIEIRCQAYNRKPVISEYEYGVFERTQLSPLHLHEDLALLLTTSGSTGSPKLVRQSRNNISSNAEAIAAYLELDASERPITSLPMNYTYGLSIINSHLLAGAAILLTQSTLFEKGFWEFFVREGATSISGVPYTYEMLKRLSFFDMELPSLRTMTQAGGKLAPRLHKEFAGYAAETGRKFIVMYGQTEATARMGYLPAKDAVAKCGSMGIAIPGGYFRLMEDETTEITTPDTVGELVYAGPNVTMGYAVSRMDLEKGDERGGILFTGDMAKRDADGYYYITGRKKRFLKLFGKRVNMDEIEQLIKAQYEGLSTACTGEDDRMRIYVAGQDKTFCDEAETWLARKTGIHPRAIQVIPIERIPTNEAGKTIYQDLP